jgi:hypothetical protein
MYPRHAHIRGHPVVLRVVTDGDRTCSARPGHDALFLFRHNECQKGRSGHIVRNSGLAVAARTDALAFYAATLLLVTAR